MRKFCFCFFFKQNEEKRKKEKEATKKNNLLPRHHELYIGRQKQNTRFNKNISNKYMMPTNLSSFRIDNLCLLYSVMRFDNNDLNAYKNQIFIS